MFILLLGSHKFGLDPRRIVESAALPGSLSSLLNGLFAVPLLLTNLSPREMPSPRFCAFAISHCKRPSTAHSQRLLESR